MTKFRANRALWTPSSSAADPGVAASRNPERKSGGGGKEEIPKTTRSKTRGRKKATCGDRDEYFQVILTSDAIRRMVNGAVKTASVYNGDALTESDGEGTILSTRPTVAGPFVMRLYNLQRRYFQSDTNEEEHGRKDRVMFGATISDGRKRCQGTILQAEEDQLEKLSECIISVSGYVIGMLSFFENGDTASSAADAESDDASVNRGENKEDNPPNEASNTSKRAAQYFPYIFITRYEVLYEKRSDAQAGNDKGELTIEQLEITVANDDERHFPADEFHSQKCSYQKRGRISSLISSTRLQMYDFMSEKGTVKAGKIVEDGLEVSNFMEQHSAIMALKKRKENASLLSSSSFSLMLGSLKYFQNYTSAIKEFDQIQREKQFTSLSDTTRECGCCDDSVGGEETSGSKSTCREEQCLKQNTETLEYALQCKDEVLSAELLLRWHAWLLGDGLEQETGSFRSEKVAKGVADFCDTLERRWLPKVKEDPTNPEKIASFAAAAMLGLLDIVPFQVGNQRLARILLNWALRRAGLPFCITLHSNREEKLDYISAIQLTRQNLCLVPQGCVDASETTMILRSTGGLSPLVGYILNRLARATADLCMLVEKKSLLASEETDARLVRLAREKAAEGSCIICFEDKPNIATLCCGKPIHFNCLAEWLKSNSTCPQCRSDLPPLSIGHESHQRTDERRVDYARDRIVVRDFSNEEFLFHSSSSSSSEDSPSSSSSSSSESSAFFYSGLDYGVNDIQSVTTIGDDESTRSIRSLLPSRRETHTPFPSQPSANYVTSDEEEQHNSDSDHGNDDVSSTNTYRSETDDDIDRYSFATNESERSLNHSNFELFRNDDIDIVSDSQSTVYDEPAENRYQPLNNENISSESEDSSYSVDNDIASRETSLRSSAVNPDFVPFRMSFLDPELLGSVQNDQHEYLHPEVLESVQNVRNERWANRVLNRNNNDDETLDVPASARSLFLRATDDAHPLDSCEFHPRRGPFGYSRRSRWS